MSGFSNILDISSFFIGVLVNLLLVAMICFYFKRKIDTLEVAQSEQAKILFELVQNNQQSLNSEQLSLLVPSSIQTNKLYMMEYPEVSDASAYGVVKPDATEAVYRS